MYNFSKKQKIIIGVILAIVSSILITYVYARKTPEEQTEKISTYEEDENAEETEEKPKEIVVHIAGAIKTEGIILLNEGARVNEAIEKAGGVTEQADMDQVNLAEELEDGEKIYIPKKEENQETTTLETNPTEQSKTQTNTNTKTSTTKVNINKATQTELETLPGIGASTASKIIAYREENGKFKAPENIKEVSGIGEAKYNSIKDLITT